MMTSDQVVMETCARFVAADSDFQLRAFLGQEYPETAHTMSEGELYARLVGRMQANVDELLRLVRYQEDQLAEAHARAARQVELIDRQAARIDRLLHITETAEGIAEEAGEL